MLPLAALGFAVGAIVGSFIAMLFVRLPQRRGFVGGRSQCDGCGRTLRAAEMVPLLSYLWLRGRCRTCGQPIGRALWIIELLAATIGALAVLLADTPQGWIWALFGWTLLLLAALDLKHYWLPDAVTGFLAIAGVVAVLLTGGDLLAAALGGAFGFAALEIIRRGYRALRGQDGMGAGDPKLLGAIGIWTGWQALPFVVVGASFAGLALALFWKLRGVEIGRSSRVPLGACLALAAVAVWFAAALKPIVNLPAL